jgi:dinuclear metal center YbgI/SA1388 family protein
MHKLTDLINSLNDFFRIEDFKDASPNGLQVEGKKEVSKAATAVTASLNIIEKAVEKGIELLIVHHGLFWRGDSYVLTGVKKEKIAQLVKHGMSLAAYHLPMDAHREVGNNWKAAVDMGWSDLEPFGKYEGVYIGVKGKFPKRSRLAFAQELEAYYGQKGAFAWGGAEEVHSAALVSGGAYKQIYEAAHDKVDCFITGHHDEPAWHAAHEEKINFISMGHAATEKVGPRALAQMLKQTYNLDAAFLDEINPF